MPEDVPRSRTLVRQAIRSPVALRPGVTSPTPPRFPRTPRNKALAALALLAAAGLLVFMVGLRGHAKDGGGPAGDADPATASAPVPEGPDQPGDVTGQGRAIHVSATAPPGGNGSAKAPLTTIQAALDIARPGDAIRVGPGTYPGPIRTVRAGEKGKPIWLIGDRARIVAARSHDEDGRPDDDATDDVPNPGRLVAIVHDRVVLDGFDISGGDINLWVFKAEHVRILRNLIHDAKGECVRMKYFSSHNEVAFNRIDRCGTSDFDVSEGEKNGEGVYIGTAPEQLKKKNPTNDPDESDANYVHDNTITSPGECVDVKESARDNYISRNTCSRGRDPESAGLSSRGVGTVFVDNVSRDNLGAGIRLGGDEDSDGVQSVVRGNTLVGNKGYGLKVQITPQGTICGNVVRDNADGSSNEAGIDPVAPCTGT
jgi:hypothetical protein